MKIYCVTVFILVSIFNISSSYAYEFTCIKSSRSYQMIAGRLYCGCLYNSWATQKGQTCVGGLYNSWQLDQNGKALCGGIYNSWQRGRDGNVCVGGNYASWQINADGNYVAGPKYNSYKINPDGTLVCGGEYAKNHREECGETSLITVRSADDLK